MLCSQYVKLRGHATELAASFVQHLIFSDCWRGMRDVPPEDALGSFTELAGAIRIGVTWCNNAHASSTLS